MAINPTRTVMRTQAEVADGAVAVIARRLAFREFEARLSAALKEDPLIDELVDLLEHEPGYGGMFASTSDRDHAEYMVRVHAIIELLRR